MSRHKYKYISWAAVVVWMGLIFTLSHQPAEQSGELSSGVTAILVKTVEAVFPFEVDRESFHYFIRKAAHFTIYFVLGVLVVNAWRRSGGWGWKSVAWSLVICVLYAISDEVHQLFIPGRSGEVRDVLIDSAGSVVGISVYILCASAVLRWKKRKIWGKSRGEAA